MPDEGANYDHSCILLFLSINHTEQGLGLKPKHGRERDAMNGENNEASEPEKTSSESGKSPSDIEMPPSVPEKPPQLPNQSCQIQLSLTIHRETDGQVLLPRPKKRSHHQSVHGKRRRGRRCVITVFRVSSKETVLDWTTASSPRIRHSAPWLLGRREVARWSHVLRMRGG